uniref:Uncharacterized protein n=1 Tax=Anguilla anguilla TaxID=7936 RepID=A0A0E9WRY5_ANGAN
MITTRFFSEPEDNIQCLLISLLVLMQCGVACE